MAITRKQFIKTFFSITLGTFLEWFDFSCFAALDHIIKKQFRIDGTIYWAIYALGFISRPLGAVLFGAIGDTLGRKAALVLSVLGVAVPSTLMGCLPSYNMIGKAAPILLAILRLLQGLALGGEFGSALVYIQEVSPAGWEGTLVNTMATSSKFAVIVGNLVVILLDASLTEAQLNLWGWRIPFLTAVITGGVALLLRRTMPESEEFTERRSELEQELIIKQAAAELGGASGLPAKDDTITLSTADLACGVDEEGGGASGGGDKKQQHHGHDRGHGQHEEHNRHGRTPSPLSPASSLAAAARTRSVQVVHTATSALERAATGAAHAVVDAATSHKVPLLDLVVLHGEALVLHFLYLTYNASLYYTVTTWLPSTMRSQGVAPMLTQGMLVATLVLVLGMAVLTGYALDRGWKSLDLVMACTVTGVAVSFAMCSVLPRTTTGSNGSMWGVMMVMGLILGVLNGNYPNTGVALYPAECRNSGMNIAYNMAYGSFGGLTPLMISLIKKGATPALATYSASWWLLAVAGPSGAAVIILMLRHPWANYTRTQMWKKRVLPPWHQGASCSMKRRHTDQCMPDPVPEEASTDKARAALA